MYTCVCVCVCKCPLPVLNIENTVFTECESLIFTGYFFKYFFYALLIPKKRKQIDIFSLQLKKTNVVFIARKKNNNTINKTEKGSFTLLPSYIYLQLQQTILGDSGAGFK